MEVNTAGGPTNSTPLFFHTPETKDNGKRKVRSAAAVAAAVAAAGTNNTAPHPPSFASGGEMIVGRRHQQDDRGWHVQVQRSHTRRSALAGEVLRF